jgi:hypothetical protein
VLFCSGSDDAGTPQRISQAEAPQSQLKGKAVMMLMHQLFLHILHQAMLKANMATHMIDANPLVQILLTCCRCFLFALRDETTVLALNGLGKVLKANMATVLMLPGFDEKWDEICGIAARVLCCGRKSVAVAAAQLLTGFLQVGV